MHQSEKKMLSIRDQQKVLPHLARSLRRRLKRLLKELCIEELEISLLLCDDSMIQELNAEWRNIDKPTDVLSFPLLEWEAQDPTTLEQYFKGYFGPPVLGDIVISVDTCIRQAKEWNHSNLDEATRLWIHGFLHLCGHDHIERKDAVLMLAWEERLLTSFSRNPIKALVCF